MTRTIHDRIEHIKDELRDLERAGPGVESRRKALREELRKLAEQMRQEAEND